MSNREGILLAVEGIDGAGKTTQVQMLADALHDAGEKIIISKEPTEGQWGQKIRDSASNGRLPVDEEIRLLTEDRKEHVAHLIRPSLEEGRIVILDRYFYSTIAYQGARGVDLKQLDRDMREIAPVPDMVFLLDLDPTTALTRIAEQRGETPNHFERVDTLTDVREKFNQLAKIDDRIWRLDSSHSPEAIHHTILHLLVENALKEKRCAKTYGCTDLYHCGPRMLGNCEWFTLAQKLNTDLSEASVLLTAPTSG